MKPVDLKFKGIGSYFGENEVDFSSLDSIFLICGETGAGKTTILDAMTLALYDESSGGERSELLNSHYRKDDGKAYSIFTFELNGKLYRFSRTYSPRPRAAGYESSQNCEYFDGKAWIPFFDNPTKDGVNKKAAALLGLSAAQFRQVVILPQGKFEKLLTSSSEEKEAILKTLFGAEKYTKISEVLKVKAYDEKKRLEKERDILNASLTAEGFDSAEAADKAAAEINARLDELKKEYDAALCAKKAADKAAADGAVLLKMFEKLDKSIAEHERLMALKPDNDRLKMRIERLCRENAALADFNAFTAAFDEKKRRENRLEMSEKILEAAEKKLIAAQEAEKSHRDGAAENERIKTEIVRLEELRSVYENAEPMRAAADKAARLENELRSRAEDIGRQMGEMKAETERKSAAAAEIREKYSKNLIPLYERMKSLEAADKSSRQLAEITLRISKSEKELADISAELEKASEEERQAKIGYEAAKKAFFAGISARMAAELSDGIPCPVCGSVHHPDKCSDLGGTVTETDLDTASEKLSAVSDRKNSLCVSIETVRGKIGELSEKSRELETEIRSAEYSEEIFAKAVSDYKKAAYENDRLEKLNREIQRLSDSCGELERSLAPVSEALEKAKAERIAQSAAYDIAKERMDKNIPSAEALMGRIEKLSCAAAAFDERLKELSERTVECAKAHSAAEGAKITAAEEFADAAERYRLAREKAEDTLLKNALPPADEFAPDMKGIGQLETMKARSDGFEAALKSAESGRKESERDTEGKNRPDTEALRKEAESADEKCRGIDFEIRSSEEKIKKINALAENYRKRDAELSAAEETNSRQVEFAEEMNGARGISFTRYVLGVMLDMVIDEANSILSGMLGGTFRLVRQQKLKANKKQGLDIMVENTLSDNCASYAAAQLSGGEKFIISLTLGVALSTVVQSRFGGISIDAMFIDEGFGSLDPSSLKDAVNMIFGISGTRRTIGIISHVEKLREEIPCCINVHKDRRGSRISY